MLIFLHNLQQLHIALHSLSEHHERFRSEYIVFPFQNRLNVYIPFKHIGDSQCLEIVTASKETMFISWSCMVVLCFDNLVAVLANHPAILLYTIWLRENYDFLSKMKIYLHLKSVFLAFSSVALIVISIERYIDLRAYFPIFHQASCRN